MALECTLIVIKPDGINKSLTGNILTKLSEADFEIIACKMVRVSRELAEEHYQHLKDQPFFTDVVSYIMGNGYAKKKVMALVYRGENSIECLREIVGATNPEESDPTSVRGKFGRITTKGIFENVVHASSSKEDAEKEIKLWFDPDESISDTYPVKRVVLEKESQLVWA